MKDSGNEENTKAMLYACISAYLEINEPLSMTWHSGMLAVWQLHYIKCHVDGLFLDIIRIFNDNLTYLT